MTAIGMRILSGMVLCIMILVWTVIALAAVTQVASPSTPSWFEHADLMQAIIAGLFIAVLWLLIRTLRKIDTNQGLLFTKVDDLCKDFYILQGEHQVLKNKCHR
jgi:uncharacterized membrane protein YhdT